MDNKSKRSTKSKSSTRKPPRSRSSSKRSPRSATSSKSVLKSRSTPKTRSRSRKIYSFNPSELLESYLKQSNIKESWGSIGQIKEPVYDVNQDNSIDDQSHQEVLGHPFQGKKKSSQSQISGLPESELTPSDYDAEKSEPEGVESYPDIEFWVLKEDLKKMKMHEIKESQMTLDEEMVFIETENYVLERTLTRIEIREKEIENTPIFKYHYPWEKEAENLSAPKPETCPTDPSSDDDEGLDEMGNYKGIKIADVIDRNDPIFGNMTEEEKEAAWKYIESIGEVAPSNFDVIRQNYRFIVDVSSDDDEEGEPVENSTISNRGSLNILHKKPGTGVSSYLEGSTFIKGSQGQSTKEKSTTKSSVAKTNSETPVSEIHYERDVEHYTFLSRSKHESNTEESDDPDFPGFKILLAQKLPIHEKLRYANAEVEALQQEFYSLETESIQEENFIQVFVDTHIYGFELLKKFRDEFQELKASGKHPLTGYYFAERIRRFIKKARGLLLSELTKINMTISEVAKVKKKVGDHLKRNEEMGENIQMIDYEWMKISISQNSTSIEERNAELNELKLMTINCFQMLKEWREKLNRSLAVRDRIKMDMEVRGNLLENFKADGEKLKSEAEEISQENKNIKRRLKAFKATNTMDYMKLKSVQNAMSQEVGVLQGKIKRERSLLHSLRLKFKKLGDYEILQDNEEWLEGIKRDLESGRICCDTSTESSLSSKETIQTKKPQEIKVKNPLKDCMKSSLNLHCK